MIVIKRNKARAVELLKKRHKELLAHIKYGRSEKSSVAHHVLNLGDSVNKNSLKLVRNVVDRLLLDAYEGLEIRKGHNLMNGDRGLIPFSCLYGFVK